MMHEPSNQAPFAPTRRSFLKSGVAAASGAFALGAAGAHAAIPSAKKIDLKGELPTVLFGKTGHVLPRFGHGGSAMIQQDIAKYGLELISMEERIKMVRHGYDKGIRLFDTARIYGESEGIMAEALHDVRDNVYLASKVMVMSHSMVRESVEKSLRELKTDYVDAMSIHGPMIERLPFDELMKQHEELSKLRDEGMIRFIGLTGHSRFDKMHQLIDTGVFDQLLIEFGYMYKGYNTRHSGAQIAYRDLCVARASELNMGILAMKVMGAMVYGHNASKIWPEYPEEKRAKLPAAAIRYVLNDPRIHILNLGISFPADIDANFDIFTSDLSLSTEDRIILAEFSAHAYQHPEVTEMKEV